MAKEAFLDLSMEGQQEILQTVSPQLARSARRAGEGYMGLLDLAGPVFRTGYANYDERVSKVS
jgi:hypothetical protein